MTKRLPGLAGGFLLLFMNTAVAENAQNPFLLSPEELFGATVVSVSKQESRLWDSPAAVTVLTNEDIRRSGATSIPEALRLVPGVNVARVNASGWAISIRGFNNPLANKLLVLMDGREVYDHLFSGVYWDVQDTPLEDIERIEVIRGPGASLWGANAVNGVINITTKHAKDTVGGFVEALAGNQEKGTVTARYGSSIGNGHVRAYGRYFSRDNETALGGGDAEDEWSQGRTGFRSDWALGDPGENLTVQGDMYKSRNGQLRDVPTLFGPPYSNVVEEEIDAQGANLLVRWSKPLARAAKIQFQSYVDYTKRDQFVVDDEYFAFDNELQYDFPEMERQKIIAGLRYRFSSDKLTSSPFATFDQARENYNHVSAFIQDQITLVPEEWLLTLGTKVEHHDYTGIEVQPNARLQWHPDDKQMFWASVSRAVRTPSRLENDLRIFSGVVDIGVPVSVELQPSPAFKSEELIAYEAGYRRDLGGRASIDAAVFYNDYDNLATLSIQPAIFPAPTPPLHAILPILTTNDTSAESFGYEIAVDWRVRDNLRLVLNHSLFELKVHGPPPAAALNSEAAENQTPHSQFSLRAQWDVSDTVFFDTIVYHTGPLKADGIDDHWRTDMRLSWDVSPQLQVSLVGQNLFDDRHREFTETTNATAAEIGRSIFGNAVWRF